MDSDTIDYGDSFDIAWGNVGDPRWPAEITVRLFRRNERGERLIVDERRYMEVGHAAAPKLLTRRRARDRA